MALIIIKKRHAPLLPVPDEIVVEPGCDFGGAVPKTRDINIGPGLELFECKVCGGLWRDTKRQGTPLARCELWRHMEAKKERQK